MKPYAALGKKFKEFIPKVATEAKPKNQGNREAGKHTALQDDSRRGLLESKRQAPPSSTVAKSRYAGYENESNYGRSTHAGLLSYKGVAQNIKSVPRSEFSVFEKVFNCLQPEEFDHWMKIFHLYMEGVIC